MGTMNADLFQASLYGATKIGGASPGRFGLLWLDADRDAPIHRRAWAGLAAGYRSDAMSRRQDEGQ